MTTGSTKGRLVLIVDPDLGFADALSAMMDGHRVVASRSMPEAAEIAAGGRLDLAIIGPSLGDEAGVNAAAALRAADPGLKMVLVADVLTNRVLRAALRSGMADVIDAPVTQRKLAGALAGLEQGAGAEMPEVDVVFEAAPPEQAPPEVMAEGPVEAHPHDGGEMDTTGWDARPATTSVASIAGLSSGAAFGLAAALPPVSTPPQTQTQVPVPVQEVVYEQPGVSAPLAQPPVEQAVVPAEQVQAPAPITEVVHAPTEAAPPPVEQAVVPVEQVHAPAPITEVVQSPTEAAPPPLEQVLVPVEQVQPPLSDAVYAPPETPAAVSPPPPEMTLEAAVPAMAATAEAETPPPAQSPLAVPAPVAPVEAPPEAVLPVEAPPMPMDSPPSPGADQSPEPQPEPPPFPPGMHGSPDPVVPSAPSTATGPIGLEALGEENPPPVSMPSRGPGGGRIITVMSGKGGSGKSITATNLATALAERIGEDKVVIVDADLQFGDIALLLQLDPIRTIVDAADAIEDLTEPRLDALLLRHDSGLRVLPAPLVPAAAERVGTKVVVRVIEMLRSMYEFVVVDTPPIFDDGLITILEHSDNVLMVVDMDLPSVKNAKIALDTLRAVQFDMETLDVVVNRSNSKTRLDLGELERSLGEKVAASIPSDRLIPQSVNEGIPAVAFSPRSKVANAFHAMARMYLPA